MTVNKSFTIKNGKNCIFECATVFIFNSFVEPT